MTEEAKEQQEQQKQQEQPEVTPEPTPSPAPEPEKLDPKEAHKRKQGKKATAKKKVGNYTKAEAEDELRRLEKAKHQDSKYYQHVKGRVAELS